MDKPPCFTQGSFWEKRHLWLPSWEQARAEGRNALVIDSIKVWQRMYVQYGGAGAVAKSL
jgi:hypothetical protein